MSQTGTQAAPLHKHVTIMDEHGHVDIDSIKVMWKNGEQVVWKTTLPKGFKVVFDGPNGSPFDTDTFEIPAGGTVYSGVSKKGGTFKYSVHGPCGCNDPIVILDPPE